MGDQVEHEICGNCKKTIPQSNYVMHTAHCARNITLCKTCKEPIAKSEYEKHVKSCFKQKSPSPPKVQPKIPIEKSSYYQSRKEIEDRKLADKRERYLERHEKFLETGNRLRENYVESTSSMKSSPKGAIKKQEFERKSSETFKTESDSKNFGKGRRISGNDSKNSGTIPLNIPKVPESVPKNSKSGGVVPKSSGLLACKFCDLELPKLDLEEHENYCGSRTDKCLECGEIVMYKNKQVHLDTNHGFVKLKDEPGPKPSWDSNTGRSSASSSTISPPRRRRFQPTLFTELSQFDATDYLPSNYQIPKPKIEKGESYKEISRRLDCKTEYIRNILHDSASITVPLRHNGAVPRNRFNHNKGPAPKPPRRKNPPTELCIPCEFCDTPIPHEDLIQHETGCRPDLACRKAISRMRRSLEEDDFVLSPEPVESEIEIPCEFCSDLIPASRLYQHQASCR